MGGVRLAGGAEEAQHALAEADEVDRVREDDRAADAEARDERQRVGGGVVVQDEPLARRAEREEAPRHDRAAEEGGEAERAGGDEVELLRLRRAVGRRCELLEELRSVVVREERLE